MGVKVTIQLQESIIHERSMELTEKEFADLKALGFDEEKQAEALGKYLTRGTGTSHTYYEDPALYRDSDADPQED